MCMQYVYAVCVGIHQQDDPGMNRVGRGKIETNRELAAPVAV